MEQRRNEDTKIWEGPPPGIEPVNKGGKMWRYCSPLIVPPLATRDVANCFMNQRFAFQFQTSHRNAEDDSKASLDTTHELTHTENTTHLPLRPTGFDSPPGRSRIFVCGNRVGGFSRVSFVSPALVFRRYSVSSLALKIPICAPKVGEGVKCVSELGTIHLQGKESMQGGMHRGREGWVAMATLGTLTTSLAVSLIASYQGESGSIPGRVTPGFPHVGIVPDYATGPRVSSGISRPSLHSCAATYSPCFILIGSQDLDWTAYITNNPRTTAGAHLHIEVFRCNKTNQASFVTMGLVTNAWISVGVFRDVLERPLQSHPLKIPRSTAGLRIVSYNLVVSARLTIEERRPLVCQSIRSHAGPLASQRPPVGTLVNNSNLNNAALSRIDGIRLDVSYPRASSFESLQTRLAERGVDNQRGGNEVRMGQRRSARVGETGDPREKPPTSGIFRQDSHLRKEGRAVVLAGRPMHSCRCCTCRGGGGLPIRTSSMVVDPTNPSLPAPPPTLSHSLAFSPGRMSALENAIPLSRRYLLRQPGCIYSRSGLTSKTPAMTSLPLSTNPQTLQHMLTGGPVAWPRYVSQNASGLEYKSEMTSRLCVNPAPVHFYANGAGRASGREAENYFSSKRREKGKLIDGNGFNLPPPYRSNPYFTEGPEQAPGSPEDLRASR
ncbi:hypothetical protein PR048_031182 [Dryococelus australis]|uniref:Uncharacterized protein n=1 Tax=Dryococelus australis TaxID=614101 RepID=A0ABQ9G4J4_9NEOP|nr:hypothetical protein PR048_031182 [Dryococelus australis]